MFLRITHSDLRRFLGCRILQRNCQTCGSTYRKLRELRRIALAQLRQFSQVLFVESLFDEPSDFLVHFSPELFACQLSLKGEHVVRNLRFPNSICPSQFLPINQSNGSTTFNPSSRLLLDGVHCGTPRL